MHDYLVLYCSHIVMLISNNIVNGKRNITNLIYQCISIYMAEECSRVVGYLTPPYTEMTLTVIIISSINSICRLLYQEYSIY